MEKRNHRRKEKEKQKPRDQVAVQGGCQNVRQGDDLEQGRVDTGGTRGEEGQLVEEERRKRDERKEVGWEKKIIVKYCGIKAKNMKGWGKYNGVKVGFRRGGRALDQVNGRSDRPDLKERGVIYRILCSCGGKYIGETGRMLCERVKEHGDYVRLGYWGKSKVSDHALETRHMVKWEESKVIEWEWNERKRKIKESVRIEREVGEVFNYRDSVKMSNWLRVISKFGR